MAPQVKHLTDFLFYSRFQAPRFQSERSKESLKVNFWIQLLEFFQNIYGSKYLKTRSTEL